MDNFTRSCVCFNKGNPFFKCRWGILKQKWCTWLGVFYWVECRECMAVVVAARGGFPLWTECPNEKWLLRHKEKAAELGVKLESLRIRLGWEGSIIRSRPYVWYTCNEGHKVGPILCVNFDKKENGSCEKCRDGDSKNRRKTGRLTEKVSEKEAEDEGESGGSKVERYTMEYEGVTLFFDSLCEIESLKYLQKNLTFLRENNIFDLDGFLFGSYVPMKLSVSKSSYGIRPMLSN